MYKVVFSNTFTTSYQMFKKNITVKKILDEIALVKGCYFFYINLYWYTENKSIYKTLLISLTNCLPPPPHFINSTSTEHLNVAIPVFAEFIFANAQVLYTASIGTVKKI